MPATPEHPTPTTTASTTTTPLTPTPILPTPAVRLDRVSKQYPAAGGAHAVRDVELDIAPGEFFSSSVPPAAARPPSCG